jgi:hypothetical protein
MTECYEQFLHGKSKEFGKGKKIDGSFDVAIFSCGWESRCKEIIKRSSNAFKFNKSIILTFSQNDIPGYKQKYLDEINSFVKSKCDQNVTINLDESNEIAKTIFNQQEIPEQNLQIEDNVISIIKEISKENVDRKIPISIAFDISSCPRRYFLSLLGYVFKFNQVKKISFYYAEGKYSQERAFSLGKWKIASIPIFDSKFDPDLSKRFFIVSTGFERVRYRSIISEEQPDWVGLLLPNPGYIPEYSKLIIEQAQPIISECQIPDNRIANIRAGDAMSAWEALKRSDFNDPEYQITYLPFGPKPHVLAMGIRGFLNKNIFVTYRISHGGYTKSEVSPTDIFWEYEISNLLF